MPFFIFGIWNLCNILFINAKVNGQSLNILNQHSQNVKNAKKKLPETLNAYYETYSEIDEFSEKKNDLKFRIMLDYFEKHIAKLNEELIDSDIDRVIDLINTPRENYDDTEYLSLDRFYKNVGEYYTIRKKDDDNQKNADV